MPLTWQGASQTLSSKGEDRRCISISDHMWYTIKFFFSPLSTPFVTIAWTLPLHPLPKDPPYTADAARVRHKLKDLFISSLPTTTPSSSTPLSPTLNDIVNKKAMVLCCHDINTDLAHKSRRRPPNAVMQGCACTVIASLMVVLPLSRRRWLLEHHQVCCCSAFFANHRPLPRRVHEAALIHLK